MGYEGRVTRTTQYVTMGYEGRVTRTTQYVTMVTRAGVTRTTQYVTMGYEGRVTRAVLPGQIITLGDWILVEKSAILKSVI